MKSKERFPDFMKFLYFSSKIEKSSKKEYFDLDNFTKKFYSFLIRCGISTFGANRSEKISNFRKRFVIRTNAMIKTNAMIRTNAKI